MFLGLTTFGLLPTAATCRTAQVTLSSEHREAAWIRVNDLPAMKDVPDIYKASILRWKHEVDVRSEATACAREIDRV
jgi:hypothetical protein